MKILRKDREAKRQPALAAGSRRVKKIILDSAFSFCYNVTGHVTGHIILFGGLNFTSLNNYDKIVCHHS